MTTENTIEELSGPVVDRRTTLSLLGAAGLGGLAGCSGGGENTGSGDETTSDGDTTARAAQDAPKMGGRLQAGWFTGSIETLDPPFISVGQYFQVAANIFNGLVTLTTDLTIEGDLAKDWEITKDGRQFTFDLREGVKFHNGTEFTAEDVQYTIHRTITNDTPAAGKLASLKEPIKGEGVVAKDDYTVEINFEKAMAPALVYLTRGRGRAATIVCKEAIEEMGQEQYALTPVGTGPFKVVKHEVGSELTLDAFDDYFDTDSEDRQLPYLDGIDVKPIPEPATLISAVRGGDVDVTNLIPLQNVSQIENAGKVTKRQAPGINWDGLAMNQNREPFNSRKARRGIAKVLSSKQFVQAAYFGNALPDQGPLNKGTRWAWREDKPDDQNYAPEEGKRLLKESGAYGASFDILTTSANLRTAKAVRQQLDRAGFDVSIEQVTSATYWDRYAALDYDVTVSGSVGDPDPDQSLWNFYRKDGPWNWVDYEDNKVHQWLADQRRALDRDEREKILHKIEDRLIADVPHAYLSHQDDLLATRERVRGFDHIPYMRNFHSVWLDE